MVKNHAPLQIRLTEPVIYLRGPSTGTDFRGRPQEARDGQFAMVRGLLTLRLPKATRIRTISLQLEGRGRTEWPEGIGPRRTDTFEEHEIINETVTYFSAQEENKSKAAQRSLSLPPGVLAQYDLDSDEELCNGERESSRGRQPMPRSSSVLPRDPEDWAAWHREGKPHQGSPVLGPVPHRQGSHADLASMRDSPALSAVRADIRGPSPAYTPPISSRPSSILLHRSGASSAHDSPRLSPRLNGSMLRRESERSDGWTPSTPTGNPDETANCPAVAELPPPAVRFETSTAQQRLDEHEEESQANQRTPGPRRTASLRSVSSETGEDAEDTEYHPVNEETLACPTNAVTTPTDTPSGSPFNRTPQQSRPGTPRRMSSSEIPANIHAPSITASAPMSRQSSAVRGESALGLNGHTDHDERGRHPHHSHKFSLAAALRGLSQDLTGRVKHHGSSSRAGSRPGSRASSRTREPPRTPHLEDGGSVPISRNASFQNAQALRSAAADLIPHGRRSRATSPARDGHRSESRGRARQRKDTPEEVHNWKEFRKGIYNYPISFQIPANAPPSIHAEFGTVQYRLKATVVRVGALTPNLLEEKEILMIAGPQEDDLEESDNVIVERQWEDQMRYQIALSGKAFPIGGSIPISIRLMPLAKCKIYRITVALEEKTDYYAAERKVARHETPRRFVLFAAKNDAKKDRPDPLLPILSENTTAVKDSPLAALARNAALNNPREFSALSNPEDDVYASLLDPLGPWHFEKELHIPDCNARIKFTTKHDSTNISVAHWLKVTIRVERGDDNAIDSKGRRKQFDIIIETPVKILDCRVNTQYNSLPSYDKVNITQSPVGLGCSVHSRSASSSIKPGSLIGIGAPTVLNALTHVHIPQLSHKSEEVHPPHSRGQPEHDDTLLERNIVYDRLISGQEAETGEEPPSYKEAVAHAIRSASRAASRSASRLPSPLPSPGTSRSQSRAASRGPSRNTSSARLYIEE